MRFRQWLPRILLVLLSLCLQSCLQIEETVSLYVHPDGKVECIAYLDQIRSSETTDAGRKQDHDEFLRDWKSGEFGVKALKASGAKSVRKELLRASPPFAATLRGTYDKLEAFFSLLDFNTREGGKKVSVTTENGNRTLTLHLPEPEPRDLPKRLHLILVQGEFTVAKGFVLSADRRTCSLSGVTAKELSCSWKP